MAEKKKEVNMTRKTISRIMGLIIAVFLLAVVLPLGSGEAKAATKGSKGDWEFEYEGKRLTITGYNGNDTDITVPSKIDGKNVELSEDRYLLKIPT